ncbi:SdpI family protein [Nocardiopsis exhalans]|uniref:SdpI family protein n=1 Tax=Nocardiopsis exhalans TaxID=163604 RepID=A0ABY5D956_9ACTN|nr:SdpI family protein [Nocardiopsis exhalans]USY20527.1 SdpI family protein [Nocardiopsis exhalans]
MAEVGGLITAGVGIVFVSGFMHYVKSATENRSLDRNSAVGIRTRVTTASDPAWWAGHRAAGPWLLSGSFTGYFISFLSLASAGYGMTSGGVGDAFMLIPGIGFLVLLVILVVATIIANKHGTKAEANGCKK